MAPELGYMAKLGIGNAAPITTALDFVSESMSANEQDKNLGMMRGTRSHALQRNRLFTRDPGGDIVMEPNAVEMAAIIRRALGGTPAGTSYPLAESLPEYVIQLLSGTNLLTYSGCKAGRIVWRCNGKGSNLQTTLTTVAKEETPGGSFPAVPLDETAAPFIFEDCIVTVGGTSYDLFNFSVTLDNFVRTRQVNSITPTQVYAIDRLVMWELLLPWGDAFALYNAGMAAGGVAFLATVTSGNTSLTLSSPTCKFPRLRQGIASRDEILFPLRATALYGVNPGEELVVTLDSTP